MSHFVCYGPLAPGSALFRGRQALLAQLTRLCLEDVQSYAIVYGGRQTGKTSLLLRLEAGLSASVCACRVDFQGLPRANAAQVFAHLAQAIAEHTGQAPAVPPSDGPTLTAYLAQVLHHLAPTRLTLLLEELGALPRESREDLANVLRALFTNRYNRAGWPLTRLMVVIAGSGELYELATSQVSTLHNICEAFYLPDLETPDALALLADGLAELVGAEAPTLAEAVYTQVRGHPYLTQYFGKTLEDDVRAGQAVTVATVDRIVEAVLTGDALIKHLYGAVRESNLLSAVRALLTGAVRFSRLDEEMARLELLGLAQGVEGVWRPRNPLLAAALARWLDGQPGDASPAPAPASGRASKYQVTIVNGQGVVIGDHGQIVTNGRAPQDAVVANGPAVWGAVSPNLLILLRQARVTLIACEEFTSNARLRDVFIVNPTLKALAAALPDAANPAARVDACMAYLIKQSGADERALLIVLLEVLAANRDPADAQRRTLENLVEEMRALPPGE